MAGSFIHGDSDRLVAYKSFGSINQRLLLKNQLLQNTFPNEDILEDERDDNTSYDRLARLGLPPYPSTSDKIALARKEMVELHQLFSYAQHKQQVETQQYFSFLLDASSLIAKYGINNPYFELNTLGQMRLKKSIVETPMSFWEDCRAAQQTYLGRTLPAVSSDRDVWDILTPPDVQFPYTCFDIVDPFDNDSYERDWKRLENFAKQVLRDEARLLKAHCDAFNAANTQLRRIAQGNSTLGPHLLKAHLQAVQEYKHNDAGKVAIVTTKTLDFLEGRLSAEEYSILIDNIYGHAVSSEGMRALCNAMLRLCVAAAALGLVAALTPIALGLLAASPAIVAAAMTPSIVVAGTSATSAVGFGAGAIYSFFASDEIEQPQTGLSYNLAQIRDAKIEEDETQARVVNYYQSF